MSPAIDEHAPHSGEWWTTEQAAAFLNRSKRRTLELIREHGLETKEEIRGRTTAQLARADGIRRLRSDREKPKPRTIDVAGENGALVKRDRAERPVGPAVFMDGFAGLSAHLARLSALQSEQPKPHQWVTLKEAAAFTGLSRSLLEQLCVAGELASRMDGAPTRQRRMVKIAELVALK